MVEVRHYVVLVVGLTVLALIDSPATALWAALAIVATVGVHRLGRVVRWWDEQRTVPHAAELILAAIVGSVVVMVGCVTALFLVRGWRAAVGFLVVLAACAVAKESEFDRARRKTAQVRAALVALVDERAHGTITEEQLAARAALLLQRDLPPETYYIDSYGEALLSVENLSPTAHHRLVQILAGFLADAERRRDLPSKLHQRVLGELERS